MEVDCSCSVVLVVVLVLSNNINNKDAASRGHSARSVASVRRTPIADFVDLFFVYRKSRGHSRAGGAAFGAFANGT